MKEKIEFKHEEETRRIELSYDVFERGGFKCVNCTDAYMYVLRTDINDFTLNMMLEEEYEELVPETVERDYERILDELERKVLNYDGSQDWELFREWLWDFEYGVEGFDI